MKRIIYILSLWLICQGITGQNQIVRYEYWFDDNYPAKVSANVPEKETFRLETIIPCTQLDEGIHQLHFRAKDQSGYWSGTVSSVFYKVAEAKANSLAAYEYWIDDNYAGKESGTLSGQTTFRLSTSVITTALEEGVHYFRFRTKDIAGNWSGTVSSVFYKIAEEKANSLAAYEYWFDDNYAGKEGGTISGQTTFLLNTSVTTTALEEGVHHFHFRTKDIAGSWSSTVSSVFYKIPEEKSNNLVAYEYWINGHYDERVTKEIEGLQTFVLMDELDIDIAASATNALHFRFKDERGQWSSVATHEFYKPIRLVVNLHYTRSVLTGDTPEEENYYPDYSDVVYDVYNITQDKEMLTDLSYPYIVLESMADEGDELLVKAVSRTNKFDTLEKTMVLTNELEQPITFNILQYGYIIATYAESKNEANVGIVYDSNGNFINKYTYYEQSLTTNELPDGSYFLVSMGANEFYNNIRNLSAFASSGMIEGMNYDIRTVSVVTGIISEVNIVSVPAFDIMLYTGNNTSFTVNKSQIAIGNYVTLRAEIDFSEDYTGQVSNIKLLVDIPENCSFVDNSVMIGSNVFNGFSLNGNQLSVPLDESLEAVRFCIIPSESGMYSPNAFVEFILDGETKRQPIGTADFAAEGLSISVPSITAQATIPVRGVSTPRSLIRIYGNNKLIGETIALANGTWLKQCELYDPHDVSFHTIYAEVDTPMGLTMQTESKEVMYDIAAIQLAKVTMYNTAHPATSLDLMEYVTVFDFINPPEKGGTYWYWPNYPDFTFKIEFTKNDPLAIKDVILNVLTSSGDVVTLPAVFDSGKGIWVATATFANSHSLPINVEVEYSQEIEVDYEIIEDDTLRSATAQKVGRSLKSVYEEYFRLYKQYKKNCPGSEWIMLLEIDINPAIKVNYLLIYSKEFFKLTNFLLSVTNGPAGGSVSFLLDFIKNATVGSIDDKFDQINTEAMLANIIRGLETMKDNPCDSSPGGGGDGGGSSSGWFFNWFKSHPNANFVQDPSGFVYETVMSNRLQGVTAAVYQKTWEEDMYGDLIEKVVLWNAEEYAQTNPVITNEYGEYAWDVPVGEWQVKFDKDGYETAYSEWLPVPPPQLNINIPMRQATHPYVNEVSGYEGGIDIGFNKFMIPETITVEHVSVTRNGEGVNGTVIFLDEESDPYNTEETFVSIIRFVPDVPFITTDEVILTVKKEVTSYADMTMTEDFVQQIEIQPAVNSLSVIPILELIMNDTGSIEVLAHPGNAAAGKKITARSVSSIASVTNEATLDLEGKAVLLVTGELPGTTQIIVALEGTSLKEYVTVNVAMPPEITEQVEMPVASLASGSFVEVNTTVELSSNTPGATIYYSYDYNESESWTEYLQPITIVEDIIIYAIAKKTYMFDSNMAAFEYFIDEVSINPAQTNHILAYTKNGSLYIKGLAPGDNYTVYSVLGYVVAQGVARNASEEVISLPGKGVYIVSVSDYCRIKVINSYQ